MDGLEYLEKLEQGVPPRVTLFCGEEDYWIKSGLAALRRRLFPGEEAGFNQEEAEAGELEEGSLFNLLKNPPFFSPVRLVIIRRIEELKAAGDDLLLKSIVQPAPGVYLALTAGKPNRRRRIFQEIMKKAVVVECRPFKSYEARKWIVEEAGRLGIRISSAIARLLVEYRGTSPAALKNELEKAALYAGEDKAGLTREEWLSLLGESTESGLFTMLDRVTEGKTGESLCLLHQLLAGGEAEIKLLFMLSRQIRLLFLTLLLEEQGQGHGELAKELQCHPYVADKLVSQVRRLSFARLRAAHRRLLEADLRIKTGRSEPHLELEMLVCDLADFCREKK